MNNIMFDIETLSTKSNAIIVQIAAVKFEFKSDTTQTFIINIDAASSKKYGMVADQSTIEWWKEQPVDVRKSVFSNQVSIETALDQFTDFVGPDWKNMVFFCNGLSFDVPIMDWSYDATGRIAPWNYWNQRDARTVYAICDLDWKNYPRVGNHHNALGDCLTQIKALKECLA